jgi:hypothetical protein
LACFENTLKRIRDEPLDEKTELWHDAQDGINECDEALARLHELLDERIRKLPTYRPPPATAAASSATALPLPAGVDGDSEGDEAEDARTTTNHPAAG